MHDHESTHQSCEGKLKSEDRVHLTNEEPFGLLARKHEIKRNDQHSELFILDNMFVKHSIDLC